MYFLCITLVMEPGINDISFKVVFDPEGKGQSLPNTIGILMKMFCISYNWKNLAWVRGCGTGKKLKHTKLRIVSIHEMEIQRTHVNSKIIWEVIIRINETELLMRLYIKRYYQCIFYRLRTLFSGDVRHSIMRVWNLHIWKHSHISQGTIINASRNTSLDHKRSIGNHRKRVDKMDAIQNDGWYT